MFVTNCRFLEFGTNSRLGRIVGWDELSLYAKCGHTIQVQACIRAVPFGRTLVSQNYE